MKKKGSLGRIARIARVKGFHLTGAQQVALAEFCESRPAGAKLIVDVANLLRRKGEAYSGADVLAMARYLA